MDDKAIIRSFESGFDKRAVAITVFAILVVISLVFAVVRGFKGHDVSKNASALAAPKVETIPTQVPSKP